MYINVAREPPAAHMTYSNNRLTSQNPFERPSTGNSSLSSSRLSSSRVVQGATEASERGTSRSLSHMQGNQAASSRPQSTSRNQQRQPPAPSNDNIRRSGRNPFEPVDNVHSPYRIPAWVEAVRSIGLSSTTNTAIEKGDT
ncbi:hypothetical protein BJ165DRAFT_1530158 [Panaeolus papilionaceus]|nr:hypothetical protein BJ165DRAFT_1530158 [Panaeolus papilionaceus]